jgi:hypothetical protein
VVIIKLQGGLGNQMFQYAFARIISEKNKCKLYCDIEFFDNTEKKPGFTPRKLAINIFDIEVIKMDELIYSQFVNKKKVISFLDFVLWEKHKEFAENLFKYDRKVFKIKPPIYLDGYFQKDIYFKGYENMVKKLFIFPTNFTDNIKKLLNLIDSSISVSIHFRRGDYIDDEIINNYHGTCSLDYYHDSIKTIQKNVSNPLFFIFSDDIEWVKHTLSGWKYNFYFVTETKGNDDWIDMMLMSRCKHNIIANSSYSWWSAWLNQFVNKVVIYPANWYNDKNINTQHLTPKKWIKI